jgi:hypothetical protein
MSTGQVVPCHRNYLHTDCLQARCAIDVMYVNSVRYKHGSPTSGSRDRQSIRQVRNRPCYWNAVWLNDFMFAFIYERKFSTQIVNLGFPYYRASVWISVIGHVSS